jgi:hypothetical protein
MWIKKYHLESTDTTLGGHMRWDLEDLRRQINRVRDELRQAREQRERDR